MESKIKIGVSSCLLGEKVRWNGEHKQDQYLCEVLAKYFDCLPICPEVEAGMSVPRETVALYENFENPRMISKPSETDWTQAMEHYIKKRISSLAHDDLCGYIFKSKSPSCALGRVPVYSEFSSQKKLKHRAGMFAQAFTHEFPWVPTEDEARLNDPEIRENFIVRIFSFYRLQTLFKKEFSVGELIQFHTHHKFLLLAHSRKYYDALGKLIAHPKLLTPKELKTKYGNLFMQALGFKSTPKKNTDALLHMMGFLKNILTKAEKEDILGNIDDYRKEQLPLIVPLTLIRHQAKKHQIEYLLKQVYLNPHPKELMLRNHV